MNALPEAEVFDFDHTLVDVRNIEHLLDFTDEYLSAFHLATHLCPPVAHIVAQARRAHEQGRAVLIATARPEKWRYTVTDWIAASVDFPITEMFMRANGDWRDDATMKNEQFDLITSRYTVVAFHDDKLANCNMARARGLNAIQAHYEVLVSA